MAISRKEVLMDREIEYPLTKDLESNLDTLLIAVNKLRDLYGKPMYVSSGYRPGRYNTAAGGAKNSSHVTCQAVDFKDADKALKTWITPEILEKCGLYMEHPDNTPTWLHVQVRSTKNRIFRP